MQKIKFLLLFLLFISMSALTDFDIKISFENTPKYKSQFEFIEEAKFLESTSSLSVLIKNQDWIEDYILKKSPFLNTIEIYIYSKKPLFILNNKFYVDENLDQFKYSSGEKDVLRVNGQIKDLYNVLEIINFIQDNNFKDFNTLNSIQYNYVSGWSLKFDNTNIRLGKTLNNNKFKLFKETLDYLSINNKIPSMIDLRYKDGVALKNG
jgi:cell division septal protein FtsQ